VCRTLISLFLPPLTTRPLRPGEGRVWKLEEEESYSYKHAGFSSSAGDMLAIARILSGDSLALGTYVFKTWKDEGKEKIWAENRI